MRTHDLSALKWTLRGFSPYQWKWDRSMETGIALVSELSSVSKVFPWRLPGQTSNIDSSMKNFVTITPNGRFSVDESFRGQMRECYK
jgi:hypothetical protein